MTRAVAVAIALVVVTACWRSTKPPPPPPPEETKPVSVPPPPPPELTEIERLFQTFEAFADDLCACTDMQCVQRVSDEMTKWSQDQAAHQTEPPKMSVEETKRAADIGERMGRCMQNAMSGSATGSATP